MKEKAVDTKTFNKGFFFVISTFFDKSRWLFQFLRFCT